MTEKKCDNCLYKQEAYDHGGKFSVCSQTDCERIARADFTCKLIGCTSHPMDMVEYAASKCYNSDPTPTHRIAKGCYKSGHHSVFEHISFTFEVDGVSRALLAQLSRHRFVSLSVQSQRYVDEVECGYVVPDTIKNTIAYADALRSAKCEYAALLDDGVPKEDARFVLPNATETKMIITMNGRELMHFCNLRMCKRAQWEIRRLAYAMRHLVKEVDPEFAQFLVPKCEVNAPYNFCTERMSCGKHPQLKDVYDQFAVINRSACDTEL